MHYTDDQFKALAPYAEEFRRAIESNYCKAPRSEELKAIRAAYVAASGRKSYPSNFGCTACVIGLMKDAGRLYFADCDERALESAKREEERQKAKKSAAKKAEKVEDEKTPATPEQATETEK